jgi:hypothetical protein
MTTAKEGKTAEAAEKAAKRATRKTEKVAKAAERAAQKAAKNKATIEKEKAPPSRREDVAKRLRSQSNSIFTTVKCGLHSRLDRSDVNKPILDSLVEHSSKLAVVGSLAFNAVLLHYLAESPDGRLPEWMELDDGKFMQSFVRNCMVRRPSNLHEARVRPVFANPERAFLHESCALPEGFGQAATYVSRDYCTNFSTHVHVNFEHRVRQLLRRVCAFHRERKGLFMDLFKFVLWQGLGQRSPECDLRCRSPSTLRVALLLHRAVEERLVQKTTLSQKTIWILSTRSQVEILHLVQQENARRGFKNFALAPLHAIKRHFATLDKNVYEQFIFPRQRAQGLFGEDVTASDIDASVNLWSMLREVGRLRSARERWRTEASFATDGVSLCVPFTKPMSAEQVEEKRLQHKKAKSVRQPGTPRPFFVGDDPGGVNIHTMVWYERGTPRMLQLHRSRYYVESGMTEQRAKMLRWQKPLKPVLDALSQHTARTPCLDTFFEYAKQVIANYDALWEVLGAKRASSCRMDVYAGKARVLDAFARELKVATKAESRGRPVVVAYGSAKFAPGGHGRPSVPTTMAYKRMSLRVRTELVDEFRTTQRSAFSFARMRTPVGADGQGQRGFKCCGHNTDLELLAQGRHMRGAKAEGGEVWMSRDGNASLNLRNILARGNRPHALRRDATPNQQHRPYITGCKPGPRG